MLFCLQLHGGVVGLSVAYVLISECMNALVRGPVTGYNVTSRFLMGCLSAVNSGGHLIDLAFHL